MYCTKRWVWRLLFNTQPSLLCYFFGVCFHLLLLLVLLLSFFILFLLRFVFSSSLSFVLSLEQWKTNSSHLKDFIILLCQQQQFRLVNYILLMSINVQVTMMNTHWTSMLIQKENPKDLCVTLFFFASPCLALLCFAISCFLLCYLSLYSVCVCVCVCAAFVFF